MVKTKKLLWFIGVIVFIILGYLIYQSNRSSVTPPIPRPLCDQSATTTDCSKIVDTVPLPVAVATTSANPVQSGKIDEHLTINNTLRDVNFCGNIYRVKQVIIDGVDVVQRIAELATNAQFKQGKGVCDVAYSTMSNGYLVSNEIGIPEVIKAANQRSNIYQLNLIESYSPPENASHIGDFEIDISTGIINIILPGYDTTSSELVGKLK